MSPAGYLKDQAYAWRCMISHVRDKAVAFANIKAKQRDVSMSIDSKSHPSFLAPICDIVATSIAKKTKQIVKCPFAKFKHLMKASSSDDDDDDDDDDECDDREADPGSLAATAVFEGYSQYFGAAIIRYDSGAIEKAVNYSQDLADGFAVAHFADKSIKLEIPNSRVQEDGKLKVRLLVNVSVYEFFELYTPNIFATNTPQVFYTFQYCQSYVVFVRCAVCSMLLSEAT